MASRVYEEEFTVIIDEPDADQLSQKVACFPAYITQQHYSSSPSLLPLPGPLPLPLSFYFLFTSSPSLLLSPLLPIPLPHPLLQPHDPIPSLNLLISPCTSSNLFSLSFSLFTSLSLVCPLPSASLAASAAASLRNFRNFSSEVLLLAMVAVVGGMVGRLWAVDRGLVRGW